MTEPDRPITEEELHAYVDGRLESDRRAAVERYLHGRPEAAARISVYASQREDLRALAAGRADGPLPPTLDLSRLIEARLTRRRSPWPAAAAAAAALALGGLGGWLFASRPASGIDAFAQELAASYAVYVADRERPVELAAERRGDLMRWISDRLSRPVAAPDLGAAGYRFLGGRLVATAHGPAALFVYENGQGTRLAVFLRPMPSGGSSAIAPADIGDADGCAWIDQGLGYAVAGPEPYARLLELSQRIRQQTQAGG